MAPRDRRCNPYWHLFLMAAFLLTLSAVPHAASASTPPLLPELGLSVSNDTLLTEGELAIAVTWDRDESAYLPPEAVQVALYSVSEEKLIKTYRIPADGTEESGDAIRHFSGAIRASELPGGEVFLTARDPISGAERRTSIFLEETGAEYDDLQNRGFAESVFAGVALLLAFGLIVVLSILVRRG